MSLVSSYFPGRIRLRAHILKDTVIGNEVIEALKENDVVKKAEWNSKTGSILLEYDPTRVDVEKLSNLIPEVKKFQNKILFYSEKDRELILKELPYFKEKIKEALN